MSRTRNRRPLWSHFYLSGVKQAGYSELWYQDTIVESAVPGPCNVVHTVINPFTWGGISGGATYLIENQRTLTVPIPPPPLNWGKLPTSSEFGILQFFAELDDTVAMFSKKFLRELSYGSFTWGVMPFVQEIESLLKTIRNISAPLVDVKYEDTYTSAFQKEATYGTLTHVNDVKYTYHLTGKIDLLRYSNQAQIFLDRLGFHPDITTAWDLVPLSFAVDWLLPVGDWLSTLHSRGWINRVHFDGWVSVKQEQKMQITKHSWFNPGTLTATPGLFRSFSRTATSIPVEVRQKDMPTDPLDLNFRKLFNLMYLSGVGSKIEKYSQRDLKDSIRRGTYRKKKR